MFKIKPSYSLWSKNFFNNFLFKNIHGTLQNKTPNLEIFRSLSNNNRFDKSEPELEPSHKSKKIKILIGTGAVIGLLYLSCRVFLPNIHLFPPNSRDLLRKALWARDKEEDFTKSIEYFNLAIEDLKNDKEANREPWLVAGTYVELALLYKKIKDNESSILTFQKSLEYLAPASIYPNSSLIGKSKKLPKKTKNKIIAINLEIFDLYKIEKDIKGQYLCINNCLEMVFGDLVKKDIQINSDKIPDVIIPTWVNNEEFYSLLEIAGTFYLKNKQPLLSIPIYQLGVKHCKHSLNRSLMLSNLGAAYHTASLYELAIATFNQAILELENFNKKDPKALETRSATLYNLSQAYESFHDDDNARKIYQILSKNKSELLEYLSSAKWKLIESKASQ